MGIALGIAGLSWVASIAIMASGGDQTLMGLVTGGAGSLIAVIVFSIIGGGAKKRYRALYKAEMFSEAVRIAVPGMSYSPASMVPLDSFKRGGLFKSRIDRYSGEDCFSGKVGATELIFSELHAQRKETTTDSKGRSQTRWVTVFKGIYLIADFHKEFRCRVMIEPDVAEANFGWLGRKMQGLSGNLVRLESPEFEQAFKVTADDPLAARYLLTPDMQDRFLALRGDWSPNLRAALTDSCLHIAIPKNEDWFEPDISAPAGDVPILHGFLMRLMIVLHITETLDLNTRLWTKE